MIYRPSLKTKLKDQKSQQVLTRAHFLKKPFEISAYVSSLGEIMMGSLRFSTLFQFPLCILFLFKQMPPVPHRRCYAVQHTAPCPYAVLLCTFAGSSCAMRTSGAPATQCGNSHSTCLRSTHILWSCETSFYAMLSQNTLHPRLLSLL